MTATVSNAGFCQPQQGVAVFRLYTIITQPKVLSHHHYNVSSHKIINEYLCLLPAFSPPASKQHEAPSKARATATSGNSMQQR